MSSPQVEPFSRSRSRSPSRTSSADEQPRKVARKERKKYSCEGKYTSLSNPVGQSAPAGLSDGVGDLHLRSERAAGAHPRQE